MAGPHIVVDALLASAVECAALAAVLAARARRVAGSTWLAAFLVGIALWCAGMVLPSLLGEDSLGAARLLLAPTLPNTLAFLLFAESFSGRAPSRLGLPVFVAVLVASFAAAPLVPAFELLTVPGVGLIPVPTPLGWSEGCLAVAVAVVGHGVLLRSLARERGVARRRVAAVLASSALGLLCVGGLLPAALGWAIPPWTLLLLPLHPALLVLGILRYSAFAPDEWARRAIAWSLLSVGTVGAAAFAGAVTPALAGDASLAGALVGAAAFAGAGPVRRLAERLVYPGQDVGSCDLAAWRRDLGSATTHADLAHRAAGLLLRRLGVPLPVLFEVPRTADAAIACERAGGAWDCRLVGWESAPARSRGLVSVFAEVLAREADRVSALGEALDVQRRDIARERLAEIGSIAAAVAHDVRGPLNNVLMAVALAPADVRDDVGAEVARVGRLVDDLLSYARPWAPDRGPVDLWDVAARAARGRSGLVPTPKPDGAPVVEVDPALVERAVANVVDNAASVATRFGFGVAVEGGLAVLRVWDDGPGIPVDLRDRVFEPFVSRRVGGTGLGLAIVAKVMAAHGGSVTIEEREPWSTCLTLAFPTRP